MGLFRPRVHTLQATHPSTLRGELFVACCRIGTFTFKIYRYPDGVQLVQMLMETRVKEEEVLRSEADPSSVLQGGEDCAELRKLFVVTDRSTVRASVQWDVRWNKYD